MLKWPPDERDKDGKRKNYIEFNAEDPTIENGLVLPLSGEKKKTRNDKEEKGESK